MVAAVREMESGGRIGLILSRVCSGFIESVTGQFMMLIPQAQQRLSEPELFCGIYMRIFRTILSVTQLILKVLFRSVLVVRTIASRFTQQAGTV